jgi:hypothetical protein
MTEIVIGVLALAGVVFGTSAAAKLRGRTAYASYVAGLGESGLIPGRFLRATAAVLAGAEVLTAVGAAGAGAYALATAALGTSTPAASKLAGSALSGSAPSGSALAGSALAGSALAASELAASVLLGGAVLAGALSAGVAVIVRRGTRARCACFGSASARPLGGAALARNLALLVVFAAGSLASVLGLGDAPIAGSLVAVAAGGIAGLVFVHLEDVVDLFTGSPVAGSPVTRAAGLRDRG